MGGNNDVITELFLPRGSLVSDIPAGDGKLVNLFYGVEGCTQPSPLRAKNREYDKMSENVQNNFSWGDYAMLLTQDDTNHKDSSDNCDENMCM
jgi:hypothetical protein